jgi:death on curing protein
VTDDVEYLVVDDLLAMARSLFGDPPPVRDLGLLESAVARPRASAFGADAYPDLVTKAAALLESVVNNHSLVDGNKRLGWVATAVFLEVNGLAATSITNDDVYELVISVASGSLDFDGIVVRLRSLLDVGP